MIAVDRYPFYSIDTKGPEIRTGLLKNGKPIQLKAGQQLTILTNANFEVNIVRQLLVVRSLVDYMGRSVCTAC